MLWVGHKVLEEVLSTLPGTQAIRGSSPLLLSQPMFPVFQGHRCCWEHLGGMSMWLKPVKDFRSTFKIPVDGCEDLPTSQLPKTSLICKFCCLLDLSPTSLEWSASFFGFSLSSSMYGGQFGNEHMFLFKSRFLSPITRNFKPTGLRWGSRICIAKF